MRDRTDCGLIHHSSAHPSSLIPLDTMTHGISVSFNPIGPWPILVGAPCRGDSADALGLFAPAPGDRRPLAVCRAVSLRLLALLLCLLAALRPSVFLNEKKKQDASIVVVCWTRARA